MTEISAFRLSAVVLAAGLSNRMGDHFKPLLDFCGKPMVRRTVEAVLESTTSKINLVETVVVTGHRADDVRHALSGLPVRCIHNADFKQGQPTSVGAGAKALTEHCHAVMIVLGDQPLLQPDDIRCLAQAYTDLDPGQSILVPHYHGQRGNPILIAAHHIPEIVSGSINVGCRHLIKTHPHEVATQDFDRDVFVLDCDTPEDYRNLRQRLANSALHEGQP